MRIKSANLFNLRAAPDGRYDFGASEPATLVAVHGPAGCGKTLFIETLIASKEIAAPYGSPGQTARLLKQGVGSGKITVEWWLDEDERQFSGISDPVSPCEVSIRRTGLPDHDTDLGLSAVLSRYDHAPSIGKVDYFPATRRFEPDAFFGGDLVGEQKFVRLGSDARKYRGLLRFVRQLVMGGQTGKQETLGRLFTELSPGVRYAGLSGVGALEFALADGEHVPLAALSASAHQAFVFAATMVMLETRHSVVFVDTPELHLGPGEAARWLRVLSSHAPTNQWIVATQDPQVVELCQGATIQLGRAEKK